MKITNYYVNKQYTGFWILQCIAIKYIINKKESWNAREKFNNQNETKNRNYSTEKTKVTLNLKDPIDEYQIEDDLL